MLRTIIVFLVTALLGCIAAAVLPSNSSKGGAEVHHAPPQPHSEKSSESGENAEYAKAVSSAAKRHVPQVAVDNQLREALRFYHINAADQSKIAGGDADEKREDYSAKVFENGGGLIYVIPVPKSSEKLEVSRNISKTRNNIAKNFLTNQTTKPKPKMDIQQCPNWSTIVAGVKHTWKELTNISSFLDGIRVVAVSISEAFRSVGRCMKSIFTKASVLTFPENNVKNYNKSLVIDVIKDNRTASSNTAEKNSPVLVPEPVLVSNQAVKNKDHFDLQDLIRFSEKMKIDEPMETVSSGHSYTVIPHRKNHQHPSA